MSDLDRDAIENLATKIQNLIMFVGLLTEGEIETIKTLKKDLTDSNSTTMAAAGTLIPLEKAEHKIAHNKTMIKRANAILAIHETNKEQELADEKLKKSSESQEALNRMFGL